jgi:hypothetical protein
VNRHSTRPSHIWQTARLENELARAMAGCKANVITWPEYADRAQSLLAQSEACELLKRRVPRTATTGPYRRGRR